uniref:NADH-ubiquinone oxidoreductase chain 5 n=1 Tax=Kulikovia alborostrata TaxID=187796 RepID=I6MR71_9BILA|nr:NADH dehydrogenase subunit 5 [Kulikovia alborostrata]AEM23549.1 NADH dehydrogenase subunit 5 [Kulikovia alborostrata]
MWWRYYVSFNLSLFFCSLFFLLTLSLSVIVWYDFSVMLSWEIFNSNGVSISMDFLFDWVSISFGCVVLLISSCVLMFTCEYMSGDSFLPRFSWLVFLFVLSMCFVIFIPNIVVILIGWDGLGLTSFLLIIYYQNFKSQSAGMLTVLMNRVGDVMILLSVGVLSCQGAYTISYIFYDANLAMVVWFLVFAGMSKSAQIPFSSWLPAAMAAPTPVSALVHSSTLVTAGVFLLIRFYDFLSGLSAFKPFLLLVASLTMLMAGMAANLETDLKKVIALSTLSQLGVMMSALGMGCCKLALFHLYTHAMFKALLFLCAGSFIHRSQHSQDLRELGMVWDRTPVITSCLHISNLALCGAPFLAGFYSKDMILENLLFLDGSLVIFFMIFLATGLTVSYSVRLSYCSLWGTFNFSGSHNWGEETAQEVLPMIFLMIGAVAGGSCFMWMFFFDEGLVFLGSIMKSLTFFVLSTGLILGWALSSLSVFKPQLNSFFGYSSFLGVSLMWFLVLLSSQGVAKNSIKLGSYFLYQGDRGWFEVFGGKGVFSVSSKTIDFFSKCSLNTILCYLGIIIFSLGMFMITLL